MVENIVAIELSYINTKHPDFQREAAIVGTLMATSLEDFRSSMRSTSTSSTSHKPAKNRPVQFANPPLANGEDKEGSKVCKLGYFLAKFGNFQSLCFGLNVSYLAFLLRNCSIWTFPTRKKSVLAFFLAIFSLQVSEHFPAYSRNLSSNCPSLAIS